jgi:hypothetical protein
MLLKERGIEDGRNSERTKRIWKGIGLTTLNRSARTGHEDEDVSGGESSVDTPKAQHAHTITGTQNGPKSHNSPENTSSRVNTKKVSEVSEVSEDQEERIHKLMAQGMSEKFAREEVLGKGWVAP